MGEAGGTTDRINPRDVQKLKYCRSLVSRAMKKFGHLDVVVNNAAFQRTYDKIIRYSGDGI